MNIPMPQINAAVWVWKAALALLIFCAGYYACYHFTYMPAHDAAIKVQTKVADAGAAQNKATAATNATNLQISLDAERKRNEDLQRNLAWYKSHPTVKWMHDNSAGGCQLSGSSGDTGKSEQVSPQSNDSPGFTPEECTFYAGELTGLLDMLHKSPNVKFQGEK